MKKVVIVAALGIALVAAQDAAAQFTFGIGFSCNKGGVVSPGAGVAPFNALYYYPPVVPNTGATGTFNAIVPGQFVFVPGTNNNNPNGPSRGLDPSAQPDLVTAINNLTTAVNNLASKVGPQPGSGFNALPPTVPAPMPKKTGSALPRKKEIEDMFAELERPGAATSSQAVGAVRR